MKLIVLCCCRYGFAIRSFTIISDPVHLCQQHGLSGWKDCADFLWWLILKLEQVCPLQAIYHAPGADAEILLARSWEIAAKDPVFRRRRTGAQKLYLS
jgi:hypothetical protein